MATVAKANKFFATHEPASHQGPECIHFAAFVPRSLSLSDAKELADVLIGLTGGAKPSPVASKDEQEQAKLGKFLLANFKNETGNETPVDCAIRLLTKKK